MSNYTNSTDLSTKILSNATFSSLSLFDQHLFKASYFLYNNKYGFIVSHLTLILVALSIITYASFASLEAPKNSQVPEHRKTRAVRGKLDTNGDIFGALSEGFITEKYALFLPFICAGGLGSMYYAFKYFDPSKISYFLNCYTLVLSLLAFQQFISHTLKIIFVRLENRVNLAEIIPRYKITFSEDKHFMDGSELQPNFEFVDLNDKQPLLKEAPEKFIAPKDIKASSQFLNVYISSIDSFALFLALVLTGLYYRQQDNMNWFFSNLVAWAFAFEGIVRFRLNSFITAGIVLTGLFFYDIYFVFFTDIMVSVAKSIQIPVLLKLPSGASYEKHIVDNSTDFLVPKLPLSMLGLGDIVIPGAVIAFCMRFDLYKHHQLKEKAFHYLDTFKLTYFISGLTSYVFGLIMTFIALNVFETAQPALLCLSPSLISGIFLTAYLNGDIAELWKYTEHESPEEQNTKGGDGHTNNLENDDDDEDDEGDLSYEESDEDDDYDDDHTYEGGDIEDLDEDEIIHIQIQNEVD